MDRGYYSIECICLLLCYKLKYPHQLYLLRGNHESRSMTHDYGFFDECYKKFGEAEIYQRFVELFDFFPLAATINQQIFCLHGGLSKDTVSLDEIRGLDRKMEIPQEGNLKFDCEKQDNEIYSSLLII